MRVNLRITLVQFITMSSSTRTVSKHQEIVVKYRYMIMNLLYNTFVGHISAAWLVKFPGPEKQGAQNIAYQTDL